MKTVKFGGNVQISVIWILSLLFNSTFGATPLFIKPAADGSSALSIDEGTAALTSIYTLLAYDSDINVTGINYTITSQVPSSVFTLTGDQLQLMSTVDYETNPRVYTLILWAQTSSTSQTSTTTMTVYITDINDEPPVIGGTFTTTIDEELPVGTIVNIPFSVTDADTADIFTYSLTGTTQFQIDSGSGVISIRQVIDFDSDPTPLTCNLVVKDAATPPHTATQSLTINIANINDNSPVFTPAVYYAIVPENTIAGVSVTQVTVTDGDSSDTVTVTIQIGDDTATKFTVDPTTGVIQTTSTPIDYDVLGGQNYMYTLVVIGVDSPATAKTGTATVFVSVTNVNENAPVWTTFSPVYDPSSPYTVDENVAAGTTVVTIQATDADTGPDGDIEYSIDSVTSGSTGLSPGLFYLEKTTGVLTVSTNTLDRDASTGGNDYYNVVIKATDKGTIPRSVNRTIRIDINDVNDNVPDCFTSVYTATIPENVGSGYSVVTIMATDGDATVANNVISYSITGGNGGSKFVIDSTTGAVTVSSSIDYELTQSFDIEITVTDSGIAPLSSTCIARVTITDMNDNTPTFPAPSITVNVPENEAVGYTVANAQATDSDSSTNNNNVIVYSFLPPSTEFTIDQNTGIITTIASLDRETTSSYILTVHATDQGSSQNTGSMTYTVSVTDKNDNAPTIHGSYDTTIDEDTALNTIVLTISATDADDVPNNFLTYSINNGDTNSDFAIDGASGVIRVRRKLDRETIAMYNLEILVVDSGASAQSASTTVTVTIGDVNDNSPIFSQTEYSFSISENVVSGTTVDSVTATDADTGINAMIDYTVAYFTVGDASHFSIDGTTGVIRTASALDREVADTYVLVVRAMDRGVGRLATTATVTLSITDYNDNTPTFDTVIYTGVTLENEIIGTSILTVTVTDNDIGVNADIILTIDTSTTAGTRADIYIGADSNTFNIYVKQIIDREIDSSFVFGLIATDQGIPSLSSTATVNITVLDVNDNQPVFLPSFYSVEVAYNDNCQGTFVTLTATDIDDGTNADITYSFTSNSNPTLFSLDGITGDITITGMAVADTKYKVNVSASDGGIPSLTSSTDAVVRIDSYNPDSVILNYHMSINCSTYMTNENTFLTQLTLLYQTTYVSPKARRWCTQDISTTSCIVRVYIIKDDTADELSELANTKTFLTIDEAFVVSSADKSGTPVTALKVAPFTQFDITKVEKYYAEPDTEADESWFETTTGIIVMSCVGAAALVAIVTGFSLAYYYKYKTNVSHGIKNNVPRKIYPADKTLKNGDLPRVSIHDTQTNPKYPIKNRQFDGRAIDPDTGRLYNYNTKSGDRSWIRTPDGEPNMGF